MGLIDSRASRRPELSRRVFLRSMAAASVLLGSRLTHGQSVAVTPNSDHGRIKPPAPVPDVPLLRFDGRKTTLAALTLGHATAVQLMFTTCTTTCPIQAAIFQHVQSLLPEMAARKIQLLSLSVNPEDDNARALAAWRSRFLAGPQWIAAAPYFGAGSASNTDVQIFFGRANGNYADHSTQVNIVDRRGRLVWRTNELPAAEEIASILKKV
jgi:protein SCO1/2